MPLTLTDLLIPTIKYYIQSLGYTCFLIIIMLIISIFIVSVIGSPKPKCLCYIVLSDCRAVVPQYLLLMPLDLHQDDGAVDYYKD